MFEKLPLAKNKFNDLIICIKNEIQLKYLEEIYKRIKLEIKYLATYIEKNKIDHISGVSTLHHLEILKYCPNSSYYKLTEAIDSFKFQYYEYGFVCCNLKGGILINADINKYYSINNYEDLCKKTNNSNNLIQFENDNKIEKENIKAKYVFPMSWIYDLENLNKIIQYFKKDIIIKTYGLNASQNGLYIYAAFINNKKIYIEE